MNISTVVGKGDSGSSERAYVSGDNLTGAAVVPGEAMCWPSSVGITMAPFVDPNSGAGFNNFLMFAGIVQDTLGTGSYGVLRRYGTATVLVSGGADVIPGAHLGLVSGTPVMAVTTVGIWTGTMLYSQLPRVTCLGTVTAGQGLIGVKGYIQF